MKDKYAIFVESSYTIPGDERSRTNPGHGYPEETVKYTEVIEFDSIVELVDWVRINDDSFSKKQYKAVKFVPLTVSKKIDFEVFQKIEFEIKEKS